MSATVLVVDDLESFRVMLRRQLVSLGHTVLEAADGAEALEVVRSRRGGLDLVLSDVVMPAMNGTEVAACICAEFPGLPVVLVDEDHVLLMSVVAHSRSRLCRR